MREIVTDDDVEKAILYLANSSKEYADTKALMKHLEVYRKSIRASEILKATGKTISENNTRGEASEAYKEVLSRYKDSVAAFTLIDAYRNVAELKVEVFRTQEASKRRGNV